MDESANTTIQNPKPTRRWFRFSIRSWFLLCLVLAIAFSWTSGPETVCVSVRNGTATSSVEGPVPQVSLADGKTLPSVTVHSPTFRSVDVKGEAAVIGPLALAHGKLAVVCEGDTRIVDVIEALNNVGAPTSDVVGIITFLDKAGRLHGNLIID